MSDRPDLIELLEAGHRRLTGLALRLESGDGVEEIGDAYQEFVDALVIHETIEHSVLYPAFGELIQDASTAWTLESRMLEHDDIGDLVAELESLDAEGFVFAKRASALVVDLVAHFDREETSVFSTMRARVRPAELLRLGDRARAQAAALARG